MSEPFIAEIRIFAGNFAPRGWAFCNGQLLPITQNTALFSLIGTTYGGDGRSTTGLPNLQGRVPMHPGRGPGLKARRLGEKGGAETNTLKPAQLPPHKHTIGVVDDATAGGGDATGSIFGMPGRNGSPPPYHAADDSNMVALDASAIADAGANQGYNHMQPFLTLNFIIALVGQYPSRS